MNQTDQRAPKPGDTVRIGDGEARFAVIDCDGATVLLESEHGVRCRAGRRVVRLVPAAPVELER